MAQPNAPKKPNPLTKVVVAILALLGLGGGADAAGYLPDIQVLKDLGIVGAVLLIAYVELRIRPLFVVIAGALAPKETAAEEQANAITNTEIAIELPKRSAVVALVPRREPP